jgi:hypothetical protein
VHQCNITGNAAVAFYARAPSAATVYDATDNWWGTTDPDSIEELVYHKQDNSVFPTVDFDPFAQTAFVFQDPTDVTFADAPDGTLPSQFTLGQNYPNPFNLTTTIDFSVPHRSRVSIHVYNILGQQIRPLLNEHMPAGHYSVLWDGTDSHGRAVSSGVYFYRLQVDDYADTKKMLLLK